MTPKTLTLITIILEKTNKKDKSQSGEVMISNKNPLRTKKRDCGLFA